MKISQFIILSAALASAPAFAQKILYKYVDSATGRVVYSDSAPKGQKNQIEAYSAKTMALKKVTPRQLSEQERELPEALEEEAKTEKAESDLERRKNQTLLATYSSVGDIEKLRDYELEQINKAIESDTQTIATLIERREQLQGIKPQNAKVAQELVVVEQNINNSEQNLSKNKELYSARQAKYEKDRAQYISIIQKMSTPSNSGSGSISKSPQ